MFLISACDFFLWGYLKSKVYVRKPRTIDDMKVSISEEIATVRHEMLVNVMQNFEERLRTCVRQEGRHLSDIIFRNWVINVSNQNCIYYSLFWCKRNFLILKIQKFTIIWKKIRSFCATVYIVTNCNIVVFMTVCIYRYVRIYTLQLCIMSFKCHKIQAVPNHRSRRIRTAG